MANRRKGRLCRTLHVKLDQPLCDLIAQELDRNPSYDGNASLLAREAIRRLLSAQATVPKL